MDTNEKLKQIKRSFRLRMNGVAAQSMRQKGLDYHINWGLSLADIQELAAEYGKAGKDWEDELTQLARERAKIKELEQEYGVELQPKDETIRDNDSDGDGN